MNPKITYSTATVHDYGAVLSLRHTASMHAGKTGARPTWTSWADEFDARACIVVARVDGRLAGSARAIFHGEGDPLSLARYFETPLTILPPRQEYAEGSRLCIHPEFRVLALFHELAAHLFAATLRHGRRYLVGGTTDAMWPRWEECGFTRTGIRYQSGDVAGIEHEMAVLDLVAAREGKAMSSAVHSIFREVLAEDRNYPLMAGE